MGVYKRGKIWWFHFTYAERNVQESAKTTSKSVAIEAERKRRREFEEGFAGIDRQRKDRVRTLADIAAVYLKEYKLKHRSGAFAEYAVRHLDEQLGSKMLIGIDVGTVSDYHTARLEQGAAPKSINDEVGVLLRILGDRGDLLRSELKRRRILKLAVSEQPGKAFDVAEKDRMMEAAAKSRSPLILPALTLALNAGMRDGEIKRTKWSQVDFSKAILTVGKSKTTAGQGRTIPLNSEILPALLEHAKWYAKKFGELKPEWYVFPFGRRGHMDPTRSVTTLKTAWTSVRRTAGVQGRWHDMTGDRK
jgi:integrase